MNQNPNYTDPIFELSHEWHSPSFEVACFQRIVYYWYSIYVKPFSLSSFFFFFFFFFFFYFFFIFYFLLNVGPFQRSITCGTCCSEKKKKKEYDTCHLSKASTATCKSRCNLYVRKLTLKKKEWLGSSKENSVKLIFNKIN
jgi:hypothetical protein